MKYCAYYLQNNKRVKVTISQILFGEVSVKGKILYSYTAGNPRVFFVGPGVNRRAHFRFENGYQGEEGGGESVTHSTYKDVIASVDQLALCFFRGKEKERVVLHGCTHRRSTELTQMENRILRIFVLISNTLNQRILLKAVTIEF